MRLGGSGELGPGRTLSGEFAVRYVHVAWAQTLDQGQLVKNLSVCVAFWDSQGIFRWC
jgi:hypothetical protein